MTFRSRSWPAVLAACLLGGPATAQDMPMPTEAPPADSDASGQAADHEATQHQGMQHEGMSHDGMQHDGMQHEGMQHEGMSHEGMQHEGMQQGDMDHAAMHHAPESPPATAPMPHAMPGMDHAMGMRGALGPYAMSREASGTSWQPEATPMPGRHFMRGDWHGMIHGTVVAVHGDSEGPRGGGDDFVESMFMAMAQRPLGDGVLALRGMVSLDPWLVGDQGYRLLLQTGETADGVTPLVDRQHPHDALMELSAAYAWNVGREASVFAYAGLPGEPALGPPTFMHRYSGQDDPEAPLGHHWLDATHISFGVATLGWTWRGFKLEGSAFNGREPDEHRTDIEVRALDSWSARVSWNPDAHWALQLSHGELASPEQLEPGVDASRTTASAMYHLGTDAGEWATTLAWGRNRKHPGDSTDAWLLESAFAWHDAWTVYGRAERVGKDELFAHDDPLHGIVFDVDKLSVGVVRDLPPTRLGRFGIGLQASHHWLPSALDAAYGADPDSWLVFVRWKL